MSKTLSVPCHIIEAVDRVNEGQKEVLVRKVREHYGDGLKNKTLAVWGLAFNRAPTISAKRRRWCSSTPCWSVELGCAFTIPKR